MQLSRRRRRRIRIPSAGGINWSLFMPTKLFDTEVTYDTPGTTDIALVARQQHVVDIAAIGGPVDANFPAGTLVGEAIGITLISTGGTGETVNQGSGDVANFSTLQNVGECSLWTWDGSQWQMTSKWVDGAALPFAIIQFDDGDLTAGAIVLTHNLGSSFPLFDLWDGDGNLVPNDGLRYTLARIDGNSATLTISGASLPIAGTWGASFGL